MNEHYWKLVAGWDSMSGCAINVHSWSNHGFMFYFFLVGQHPALANLVFRIETLQPGTFVFQALLCEWHFLKLH